MNPFKVFAGIMFVMVGLSLLAISSLAGANAQYGAVVIIGPIPIVLASSPDMAVFLLIFAVMIIALAFIFARW
jgi:uncharacterized protein (TIGR00304 family)